MSVVFHPPSATIVVPVMYDASSLASQTIVRDYVLEDSEGSFLVRLR